MIVALSCFRRMHLIGAFSFILLIGESFAGITEPDAAQNSRFRVTNMCEQALWIQQDFKSHTNDPIVVEIAPGLAYDYSIPDEGLAATRFWAKSGCNEHGYDCAVGESTGVPEALDNGWQKGPFAPDINSKFEATWGCAQALFDAGKCAINKGDPNKSQLGTETWWNGSTVDGYTFAYAINVLEHNNTCKDSHLGTTLTDPDVDCGSLRADLCPSNANISTEGKYNIVNGFNLTNINLQWIPQNSDKAVGCFSPCAKLTSAQGSENGSTAGGLKDILGGLTPESPEAQMYCCPTPPVSSPQCIAGPASRSSYSLAVSQTQKCDAYTYAYDDAKGLARCGPQTKFEVVFCPKDKPKPASKDMKFIIPQGVVAKYNGATVNNEQIMAVVNGGVVSVVNGDNIVDCVLKVDANDVAADSGSLCASLVIANNSITFPNVPPAPEAKFKMQYNFNPHVGITPFLNDTALNNAAKLEAANFPAQSTLKAFQANKSATCQLTIGTDSISRGNGEFCNRLNIVKDGAGLVHVYLPADIPDMGTGGQEPKYVVFGMSPDMYADFLNHVVTNGSKIALSSFEQNQQIQLIAHQHSISASCIIGKSGDTLSIIHDTGLLCAAGLVVHSEENGDYFIGLPNPLPKDDANSSGSEKAFGLGIAAGMQVEVNGKIISWNLSDKTVYFKDGVNSVKITGNNGLTRECSISLAGDNLSWPKSDPACQGVVVHGDVLYFPAF